MKIGTDIVETSRFKNFLEKHQSYDKIFTQSEMDNIFSVSKPEQRASGYYAVKESVLKAFGIGLFKGIELTDICVGYLENGAPFVEKNAKIKEMLKKQNCSEIEISISHENKCAVAVCLIY